MVNNLPCISVIVPVYNAERYLDKMIAGISEQRFTDFELLLVDDGSVDGSGRICDKYAQGDDRIKVFHNENGGVAKARNYGLSMARGEWIAFVDSDDYVTPDYLSDLYAATSANVDLVIQHYNHILEDGSPSPFGHYDVPQTPCVYDKEHFNIMVKEQILNFRVHSFAKLFRRRLIVDNQVCFPAGVSFGEDYCFLFRYLYVVEKGVHCSVKSNYYYVDHPNSAVHRTRDFDAEYRGYKLIAEAVESFLRKYHCSYEDVYLPVLLHRAIFVSEKKSDIKKVAQADWIFFKKYFKPISRKTTLDKWMINRFHGLPFILLSYIKVCRLLRTTLVKMNLWKLLDMFRK